mgnify:CR=1 FL=1
MDFALQRQQQQDAARIMMFQNSGYQFERRYKKTLILDITDQGTVATNPLTNGTQFSVDLFEPLIIDKLSDIYLDSVLTHNCNLNGTNDNSGFCLKINEFNINSNCASTSSNQHLYNSIFIPNENNDVDNHFSTVTHKGKKMNYVCSINPGKITQLTGKLTDLAGNPIYTRPSNHKGNIKSNKLYYVKVAAVAAFVPAGTKFSINGGISPSNGVFTVANDMLINSTDLYFNHIGSSPLTVTTATLGTIVADGSIQEDSITVDNIPGFQSKAVTPSSLREGDPHRFIAEFVIVSRD